MLAHHTINGNPTNAGDLLGSGTISGREPASCGSMFEMTQGGEEDIMLAGMQSRAFLGDGDSISITGMCQTEDGSRVGFGDCVGTVRPAVSFETLK